MKSIRLICGIGLFVISCGSPCWGQSKKAGASASSTSSTTAASASPTSTGSGSTAAFDSQIDAVKILRNLAGDVANDSCAQVVANPPLAAKPLIVVFDSNAFASLQAYQAFIQNASFLESAYGSIVEAIGSKEQKQRVHDAIEATWVSMETTGSKERQEAAKKQHNNEKTRGTPRTALLSLATTLLPVVTPLLSAMAVSSNAETSGSIAINDSALAALIIKKGCAGADFNFPAFFGKSSPTAEASREVLDIVDEVHAVRAEALKAVISKVGMCKASKKDAANTQPLADGQGGQKATDCPADSILAAQLTDINGVYDSFVSNLVQTNATTGMVGSAVIVQGHDLATGIQTNSDANRGPAYVLLATVVSAGGTQHTHRSFWTSLGHGDQISYSGGVIIEAVLWDVKAGQSKLSDVYADETPLVKVVEPK